MPFAQDTASFYVVLKNTDTLRITGKSESDLNEYVSLLALIVSILSVVITFIYSRKQSRSLYIDKKHTYYKLMVFDPTKIIIDDLRKNLIKTIDSYNDISSKTSVLSYDEISESMSRFIIVPIQEYIVDTAESTCDLIYIYSGSSDANKMRKVFEGVEDSIISVYSGLKLDIETKVITDSINQNINKIYKHIMEEDPALVN